jgi:methylenetetrahydrofolate reductase (NADPH)
MRVIDHISSPELTLSVEIEPPLLRKGITGVYEVLDPLVNLGIKYVDITYHSERIIEYAQRNGFGQVPITTRKKPGTLGVAGAIIGRYAGKIDPVPHVICTSFTKYDTENLLAELDFLGVNNILALRGDPPRDRTGQFMTFESMPHGNANATELIEQVDDLRRAVYVAAKPGRSIDFCIGAACYPEKYAESTSLDHDIDVMKAKVDAGAEYFVTQMFFNNEKYFDFIELVNKNGLNIPIVPGITPVSSYGQLEVIPRVFNTEIPAVLKKQMEPYCKDAAAVEEIGLNWAISQTQELIRAGTKSLHFYASRGAKIKELLEGIKQ